MNIMREKERKKKSDALGSLGLERTTSLSLLDRMEADSLRQFEENTDLQRTLSAGDLPISNISEFQKRIKEQQESEAIFNKQKQLANEIKNIAEEEPSMEEKPIKEEELSIREELKKVGEKKITIQPRNPLGKFKKKSKKKVVKSGSSEEVAMEETY